MEQKLFYSESFNVYLGPNGAPYKLIKYPDIQVKPQHDTLINTVRCVCYNFCKSMHLSDEDIIEEDETRIFVKTKSKCK